MFEVNKPVKEAPLLGAVVGGLMGGGALGGAGILGGGMLGGLVGAGLGAAGGMVLESLLKPPKMPNQSIEVNAPAPQDVPSTPPAAVAPTVPATPAAPPATGGGLGAPTNQVGGDTPVDLNTPVPETFTPGEASTATPEEVSQGELKRKRRGRVSTILTNREATVGEEEVERLGG